MKSARGDCYEKGKEKLGREAEFTQAPEGVCFPNFLKVLGLQLQTFFRTQCMADLLHGLLPKSPAVSCLLLLQYLLDILQHLLHLDVIHGIQRLQDGEFSHHFHTRSG